VVDSVPPLLSPNSLKLLIQKSSSIPPLSSAFLLFLCPISEILTLEIEEWQDYKVRITLDQYPVCINHDRLVYTSFLKRGVWKYKFPWVIVRDWRFRHYRWYTVLHCVGVTLTLSVGYKSARKLYEVSMVNIKASSNEKCKVKFQRRRHWEKWYPRPPMSPGSLSPTLTARDGRFTGVGEFAHFKFTAGVNNGDVEVGNAVQNMAIARALGDNDVYLKRYLC
jgi:hypothetical protein